MRAGKVDAVVFLDAATHSRRSIRPHPTYYAESLIDSVQRNEIFRFNFYCNYLYLCVS